MADPIRFAHYEVLTEYDGSPVELGRGAMGITYKAFDPNLRLFVALKVINPAFFEREVARQRFVREARAAAQLRHTNIASVLHLGVGEDAYFYAMEFVDGDTVEALVRRDGPIDPRVAISVAIQVAMALAAASKFHLVHRDIKPANIMLVRDEDGYVAKVIDFGLAKSFRRSDTNELATVSQPGFVGSAQFASPEQLMEKELDVRSDIYSLGVTLWYTLVGRPPFTGSIAQVMAAHLHEPPPVRQLAKLPKSVQQIVARMIEKDLAKRPQTASALRVELERCLAGIPLTSLTTAAPAAVDERDAAVTEALDEPGRGDGNRRRLLVVMLSSLVVALTIGGIFAEQHFGVWQSLHAGLAMLVSKPEPLPTSTPSPVIAPVTPPPAPRDSATETASRVSATPSVAVAVETATPTPLGSPTPSIAAIVSKDVTARLSAPKATVGEVVRLIITVNGKTGAIPPKDLTCDGLEIQYAGQSTEMNMSGSSHFATTVAYDYNVKALRSGRFRIPSAIVAIKGKYFRTPELWLEVTNEVAKPIDLTKAGFAELTAGNTVTRCNTEMGIMCRLGWETRFHGRLIAAPKLTGDDFLPKELAEFLKPTTETINGRKYTVLTYAVNVTCARSGNIRLGPVEAKAIIQLPRRVEADRSPLDIFNMDDQSVEPFFRDAFAAAGEQRELLLKSESVMVMVEP